ncbi:hypothetical protein BCR34DRAFT_606802 [Clohesyomyces aquaticus]|uniref:Glycine zipper domain-containing protein n=1 Tax=Clohesyomyces aquaticus TaxID=1231657 RepID=A0A1Y1YLC2_9PLEO|nr:hypothetical protein BCR34DRAFT_606802 [Clohesyomyces aquaticus]
MATSQTGKPPNPQDYDPDQLKQAAATAQKALDAQSTAKSLKEAASSVTDPKKHERLLREAYDKEIEAHGNSKKARMLQSGAFQGGAGGAGIGALVGMGVGTVVGTVVGAVTTIPTTALGTLVGSGVGLAHGPWIKLPPIGGGKKGEKEGSQDVVDAKEGEEEDDDGVVPNPELLRQAANAVAEDREKRKPRKLERPNQSRSQSNVSANTKEKRKPRKIEIRSKQQQKDEQQT